MRQFCSFDSATKFKLMQLGHCCERQHLHKQQEHTSHSKTGDFWHTSPLSFSAEQEQEGEGEGGSQSRLHKFVLVLLLTTLCRRRRAKRAKKKPSTNRERERMDVRRKHLLFAQKVERFNLIPPDSPEEEEEEEVNNFRSGNSAPLFIVIPKSHLRICGRKSFVRFYKRVFPIFYECTKEPKSYPRTTYVRTCTCQREKRE